LHWVVSVDIQQRRQVKDLPASLELDMNSTKQSSVILFFALSVLGCGTSDRIDNRLDCRQICDRYAECFDGDYDVDECKEDCRDNANDDADFETKVERCSDCLDDDNSCSEDTFSCSKDCIGIVP